MSIAFYRGTDGIFGTAGNWKLLDGTNHTPVDGDTLVFDRLSGSLTSTAGSLDQSGLDGMTLYVYKEFTGTIGSIHATTGVPTYFQLDATVVEIGAKTGTGSPAGSPLILLDTAASACVCRIYDSASTSNDTYRPPIQLKGTALTVIHAGGKAGVALRDSETSTVTYQGNPNGEASEAAHFTIGRGTTRTAVEVASECTVLDYSDNTATSIINRGNLTTLGSGAITAAKNYETGVLDVRGTGTITALENSGSITFAKDARAKTVSAAVAFKGSTWDFRNGNPLSVTLTTGIDFYGCNPEDCTVNYEPHITLTPSAI
jgi:hypothetical protein